MQLAYLQNKKWRRSVGGLIAAGSMLVLGAAAASGQTFHYTENFDAYNAEYWWANGAQNGGIGYVPPGWLVSDSTAEAENKPRVFGGDYWWWGTNDYCPWWCSALGAAGAQDYSVSWSNSQMYGEYARFNLVHPGWDTSSRATGAWYVGSTPAPEGTPYYPGNYPQHHTGSYPLHLKTDSFKAEFDLSIRTGNNMCGTDNAGHTVSADGCTFSVQPVQDLEHVQDLWGWGGGQEGAGLNGFSVEFDIYPNGVDPAAPNQNNHVGLNVNLRWRYADADVTSVVTNADPPFAGSIPRMIDVGDNNQPLHVTVYYNDPLHGGASVVQVYLKIDPNLAPENSLYPPFSFGMDAGDPPEGRLIIEGCIGGWPTDNAVFGFTAGTGGCNALFQVDNVDVLADTVTPAEPCAPPWAPTEFAWKDANHPDTIELSAGGKVADDAGALSRPGWDVGVYPQFSPWWWGDPAYDNDTTHMAPVDAMKQTIAYYVNHGVYAPWAVGQPAINYWDAGDNGNLGFTQLIPNTLTSDQHYFGIVAKGWIYFPQAGDFSLAVNSDNGYELKIGGQLIAADLVNGSWGSGINAGQFFQVHVGTPGVYPIQLIWNERWGGAFVEFYRRTDIPLMPYVPIGSSTYGLPDQPLIFGLHAGAEAAMDAGGVPEWPVPYFTLAASQKVGDIGDVPQAGGGPDPAHRVFKVKGSLSPLLWNGTRNIYANAGDEVEPIIPLRLMDVLGEWTTAGVIDYSDGAWWQWPGYSWFPGGFPSPSDNFAFRAEGYIYFPTPGSYLFAVVGDDYHSIKIGEQTLWFGACCQEPSIPMRIDVVEAGLYPIRIDLAQGGGGSAIEFTQLGANAPWVLVNGPGSTVQVYDTLTTGEYAWKTNGMHIPADRKVAEVGQGGTLGWNATFVKTPGYTPGSTGDITTMVENNWYVPGYGELTGSADQSTAHPLILDFVDEGDIGLDANLAGRFTVNNTWGATFGPPALASGNDNFGASFSGYMEFPAAGDYLFNVFTDDGAMYWIGGVNIGGWWFDGIPSENTFMSVRIDEPGIYDVRLDYLGIGGTSAIELVRYLPDGNPLAPNDPASEIKVYQDLAVPALTETWHNPTRLPLGAKVGEIDHGGEPGFAVYMADANVAFTWGNAYGTDGYWWGWNNDRFLTVEAASEMLDALLGGPISLSHPGTLLTDATHPDGRFITPTIDFGDGAGGSYPAVTQGDYFGLRAEGVIALKKGGHVFTIGSDDGAQVWIGGQNVSYSGNVHGRYSPNLAFYVYAPEDGLYPLRIDNFEAYGGQVIQFFEAIPSLTPTLAIDEVLVNTGSASKVYVEVSPCGTPFMDADGLDGDIDQADFGEFQACFTGDLAEPQALSPMCRCFDSDANGLVNMADFGVFQNCISGPGIPWAATANCPR